MVIQASQREEDSLQTRTVSNYNQNHALTIQYYEVLRHFVVTTTFDRMEPVVFIPFQPLRFDRETALRYRRILEANALDRRLPSWLDASERLGYSGNYPPSPAGGQSPDGSPSQAAPAPTIARLQVQLTTGDQETRGPVTVELGLRDGTWAKAAEISGRAFGVETILEKNSTSTSDIAPDGTSDPDYALGAKVAVIGQTVLSRHPDGKSRG